MSEYVIGFHAVKAALVNKKREIKILYITRERHDKRIENLIDMASRRHIKIEVLDSTDPRLKNESVSACVAPLLEYTENDLETLLNSLVKPALILILDGITDPHNLGACLRSANAAGVDFIILPKDNSASITPVVSKVACGAAESMSIIRLPNLARAMEKLKQAGVWLYGGVAEKNATSLYSLDCKISTAFVMGSEGDGLRRLTRESCDVLFTLPMASSSIVSSLNVSVATGICLFEAVRQRK